MSAMFCYDVSCESTLPCDYTVFILQLEGRHAISHVYIHMASCVFIYSMICTYSRVHTAVCTYSCMYM